MSTLRQFKHLLTGGPKLWSIGDHRIEKIREREQELPGHGAHGTAAASVTYKNVTKYRCVDCEQKFGERDRFFDAKCYEVIE